MDYIEFKSILNNKYRYEFNNIIEFNIDIKYARGNPTISVYYKSNKPYRLNEKKAFHSLLFSSKTLTQVAAKVV